MTRREPTRRAPSSRTLFVDRQIYEHRPGGGRCVPFPRTAQLRLLTRFVAFGAVAAIPTTGLVLGYRLDREQSLELARLQAGSGSTTAADEALAQARGEIDRLRAALDRAGESGALEDERAALEVEKRSVAAELESAEAKVELLTGQLESAERARQRLGEELEQVRQQAAAGAAAGQGDGKAQLEALSLEVTLARHERDSAWGRVTTNRVPGLPSIVIAFTSPFISLTSAATIARPSPVPPRRPEISRPIW